MKLKEYFLFLVNSELYVYQTLYAKTLNMFFTLLVKNSRSFENMKFVKAEENYLGKIKT